MKYGKYLKGISNIIENTRIEIYQDKYLDWDGNEEKEEVSDKLLKIQSDLRNVAEEIGWAEGEVD